jgi:hypothetical protein
LREKYGYALPPYLSDARLLVNYIEDLQDTIDSLKKERDKGDGRDNDSESESDSVDTEPVNKTKKQEGKPEGKNDPSTTKVCLTDLFFLQVRSNKSKLLTSSRTSLSRKSSRSRVMAASAQTHYSRTKETTASPRSMPAAARTTIHLHAGESSTRLDSTSGRGSGFTHRYSRKC